MAGKEVPQQSGGDFLQPTESERPLATIPRIDIFPTYILATQLQARKLVRLVPVISDSSDADSGSYVTVYARSSEGERRYKELSQHPNFRSFWFAYHGQSDVQLDYALKNERCTLADTTKRNVRAWFVENQATKEPQRIGDRIAPVQERIKQLSTEDPFELLENKIERLKALAEVRKQTTQLEVVLRKARERAQEFHGKKPSVTIYTMRREFSRLLREAA